MARVVWDQIGEKFYETGVDRGMLYLQKNAAYPEGVTWNGLTAVTESPSGAEATPLYADNIKYLNLRSAEDFGATIECLFYPKEWSECNGETSLIEGVSLGQQARHTFGFSYRTKVGNDTDNEDHGYKIHMLYGCSSSPSEKSYSTVNDSPEVITFSYEITTTPVPVSGVGVDGKPLRPTACITVDSRYVSNESLAKLEDALYGSETDNSIVPHLPLPEELRTIFAEAAG